MLSAALFLLLLASVLLAGRGPLAMDRWWQPVVDSVRSHAATSVLTAVSDVGAGLIGTVVVPSVISVGFLLRHKRAQALTFVVTVAASAVLVQVLKVLVARPRPAGQSLETTLAFPSGHVTNAATVTVLLVVLLRRRWLVVLALIWTLVMAVSRTYLGVHWLTDTLAGACLGTSLALTAALAHDVAARHRARRAGDGNTDLATPSTPGAVL